jgi:hypothetical protein
MKSVTIKRYNTSKKKEWDLFIDDNNPFTFLFYRDYMDYHSNRFTDYSLMIFQDATLIALFPANISDETIIYSHQGLSYGGLIYDPSKWNGLIEKTIYQGIIDYFKTILISKISIKIPPHFYGLHMERQINILSAVGADVQKSFLSMAANMEPPLKIHKSKYKRYRKRKQKNEFTIKDDNDFKVFWNQVLTPCLEEKYQSKPVHELDEILELHRCFPKNIVQWNLYFENKIIAGITIFFKNDIIRSQYGATRLGYEAFAPLDYLYIYLFEFYYTKGIKIFDMGSIPPNDDLSYPEGLVNYKKELGCDTHTQNQYVFIYAN